MGEEGRNRDVTWLRVFLVRHVGCTMHKFEVPLHTRAVSQAMGHMIYDDVTYR